MLSKYSDKKKRLLLRLGIAALALLILCAVMGIIFFVYIKNHIEIEADVILLAKNVDGVYNADPAKDPTATKYDEITYDEVLAQHLMVMDTTATSLAMDNHIPVLLFALKDPQNIVRALCGENVGTIVKE